MFVPGFSRNKKNLEKKLLAFNHACVALSVLRIWRDVCAFFCIVSDAFEMLECCENHLIRRRGLHFKPSSKKVLVPHDSPDFLSDVGSYISVSLFECLGYVISPRGDAMQGF